MIIFKNNIINEKNIETAYFNNDYMIGKCIVPTIIICFCSGEKSYVYSNKDEWEDFKDQLFIGIAT